MEPILWLTLVLSAGGPDPIPPLLAALLPGPGGPVDPGHELGTIRRLLDADAAINPRLDAVAARRTATLWVRAWWGDRAAQTLLGFCHSRGKGVAKDEALGAYWWGRAARAGDPIAQFYLAGAVAAAGKGPEADREYLHWLRQAAEAGLGYAQVHLGLAHEDGTHGLSPDPREAVRWFRRAAEAGFPRGEVYLGDMYAWGNGVPKNQDEAMRWFRKAADRGYARGQCRLGDMYAERGLSHSAEGWYRKAAAQGDDEAMYSLGWVLLTRDPRDETGAAGWYRKAADRGHPEACVWLAAMHALGRGVPKDAAEADRLRKKAGAELGDADEQKLYTRAAFAVEPVGQPAPDFTTTRAGRRVRLSELRGQSVLVWFGAATCGPDRVLRTGKPEVEERWEPRGVAVVYVDTDSESEPGLAFGVRAVPRLYVIDARGVCRAACSGGELQGFGVNFRFDQLAAMLEPWWRPEAPPPWQVPARPGSGK